MCCRYYYDEKMAKEIEKICMKINEKLNMASGEYGPAQKAPVITGRMDKLTLEEMQWGFPQHDGKGLLINARCEGIEERKAFGESVQRRRCVIPASEYYEWDAGKHKVAFSRVDDKPIYMAGVYNLIDNKERFVVITTEANETVKNVHDRMPLILEESEIDMWIHDHKATDFILHKKSPKLKKQQEYEQQTLQIFSDIKSDMKS